MGKVKEMLQKDTLTEEQLYSLLDSARNQIRINELTRLCAIIYDFYIETETKHHEENPTDDHIYHTLKALEVYIKEVSK